MGCGSPLGVVAPDASAPVRRKLTTVLFCDLVGSTALGELLDIESLREVLLGYFTDCQRIIEHHGGRVEKFIGDAVFAVFGLPYSHEDDALRAVRAGLEIQQHIAGLNVDLEQRYGQSIEVRIGINSGEMLASPGPPTDPLVAGDIANVAARLQGAAKAGDVLIGERTERITRGHLDIRSMDPLALKGKSAPVSAYRVEGLRAARPRQLGRATRAFVGREAELEILGDQYGDTVFRRAPRVVVISAHAGMGKTRLASEFLSRQGSGVTLLAGQCRPPGDSTSYRPIIDMLAEVAPSLGMQDLDGLRADLASLVDPSDLANVAGVLATMAGFAQQATSPGEIAWAVRRLVEGLADRQPVVVVLDDLQWADRALVDLMVALDERLTNVSVLILLLSRPSPSLAKPLGRIETARLELAPLSRAESALIIDDRIGSALGSLRDALVTRAGGNPLFVEELVAMLIDDGTLELSDGTWRLTGPVDASTVPATIEALIDSRLDALPEHSAHVIERAAIDGELFSTASVSALAEPTQATFLERALADLAERDLIVERGAVPSVSRAYAFRHVLVRDVAYRRIPKRLRAELHEEYAAWVTGDGSEFSAADADEIAGHHLELAYRYRTELFRPGPQERSLAGRAARRLRRAGDRTLSRGELGRTIDLLRRAVDLTTDEESLSLLPLLGAVLGEAGRLAEATQTLERLIGAAGEIGSEHLVAMGRIEHMILRLQTDPVNVYTEADRDEAWITAAVEQAGQTTGLARFWHLKALLHWNAVHCEAAADCWRKAAQHARLAGDQRRLTDALSWQASAAYYGPMPVDAGLTLCREIVGQVAQDRLAQSQVQLSMACLHAMAGRRREAAELVAASDRTVAAIGQHLHAAAPHREAFVALVSGDPAEAERRLAAGSAHLQEIGDHALLSKNAAMHALALVDQQRHEEAMRLTVVSEHEADDDDVATHVAWRVARGRALTADRRHDQAIGLLTEAIDLAERTDCLVDQADAWKAQAEALLAQGDTAAGTAAVHAALSRYERKGHTVGATRCRQLLARADGS